MTKQEEIRKEIKRMIPSIIKLSSKNIPSFEDQMTSNILACLHSQNVVIKAEGDLKLGNILLNYGKTKCRHWHEVAKLPCDDCSKCVLLDPDVKELHASILETGYVAVESLIGG